MVRYNGHLSSSPTVAPKHPMSFLQTVPLEYLFSQRNDFHEFRAQFAWDRSKDAGADRLVRRIDQNRRIGVAAVRRAIRALKILTRTHDDRTNNLSRFYFCLGVCRLDGRANNVADPAAF